MIITGSLRGPEDAFGRGVGANGMLRERQNVEERNRGLMKSSQDGKEKRLDLERDFREI